MQNGRLLHSLRLSDRVVVLVNVCEVVLLLVLLRLLVLVIVVLLVLVVVVVEVGNPDSGYPLVLGFRV